MTIIVPDGRLVQIRRNVYSSPVEETRLGYGNILLPVSYECIGDASPRISEGVYRHLWIPYRNGHPGPGLGEIEVPKSLLAAVDIVSGRAWIVVGNALEIWSQKIFEKWDRHMVEDEEERRILDDLLL